jgi:hypothetical protein
MNVWASSSTFQGGGKRRVLLLHHSISVIASKTRHRLASMLIIALGPFHDEALVLTGLNVVWVRG